VHLQCGQGDELTKDKYGVRSSKFIWAPCVQLYSLAETPVTSPLPPHLGSYTRALLVSQDRRHLFVTPYITIKFHVPVLDPMVEKAEQHLISSHMIGLSNSFKLGDEYLMPGPL
jgi:hypothetical protein